MQRNGRCLCTRGQNSVLQRPRVSLLPWLPVRVWRVIGKTMHRSCSSTRIAAIFSRHQDRLVECFGRLGTSGTYYGGGRGISFQSPLESALKFKGNLRDLVGGF